MVPSRWVILGVALLAFVQTHMHRMAFAPLLPTFVRDLGLTYVAAATLQTAYFWTYALVQIPVGLAADRYGARAVICASMSILMVGALAFAAGTTYAASLAGRALVGLGAAGVWVPAMRIVSELFPPATRGRATGLFSSGGGVGDSLGLIVVPWLAGFVGWRLAYGGTALPALVTAIIVVVMMPRPCAMPATARPRVAAALARLLVSRPLWSLNVAVFLSYGAQFSLLTFLPVFLVARHGASEAQAGVVTALLAAGTTISWPLAGVLSDRVGRRKPFFLLSQATWIAVALVFTLTDDRLGPGGASVVTAIAGLLFGGTILPYLMAVELFSTDVAATAASVINGAALVGGILVPIVIGRIIDVTGSFATAFAVTAVVHVAAFACALLIPETGWAAPSRDGHATA